MATTPPIDIKPLVIADLTTEKVDGQGAFDVLMRSMRAHLEQEFALGRIRGPEYATVYLGSLEQVMQTSLSFLMNAPKAALEAQLLGVQIELAKIEVLKAEIAREQLKVQTELIRAQVEIAKAEVEIKKLELQKVPAEIALLSQQRLNLRDDLLTAAVQRDNLGKQGFQIEAQTDLTKQQATNARDELLTAAVQRLNLGKQGEKLDADIRLSAQQLLNAQDELLTSVVQRDNLTKQGLQISAQTVLTTQQGINAVTENTVLVAQECKLRAEYDLTMQSVQKSAQEVLLLAQKVLTEKAQVTGINVDVDSVIGRQKALYAAQTDGFKRDAEQKVAKIMIDTWNVRRTTDEGTVADGTNKLDDPQVGRAVTKMFEGIQA